ncbi:hypothetical protein ACFLXJ_00995 [Chloroflexota bacterium]
MAAAAITLGIVGLFTWMIPPVGLIICIIGIIFSAVALLKKTPGRKRAIAGLVTGSIGAVLSILVLAVGLAALGMMGIFGEFFAEWIDLYGLPY